MKCKVCFVALLAMGLLISIPCRAQTVLLSDNFSSSSLNTSLWSANCSVSGNTIALGNGGLTFNLGTAENGYGTSYLISNQKFTRPAAPNALRWSCDIFYQPAAGSSNTVAAGICFTSGYTVGVYKDWIYFCNTNNGNQLTFGDSWDDYKTLVVPSGTKIPSPGFISVRCTLAAGNTAPGALYEYNLNTGNGWVTYMDTRATAGANDSYDNVQFLIDPRGYSNNQKLVVNNIVIETVNTSSVATPVPTPTPVPKPVYQHTLLQDNFSGNSLDTTKWQIDTGSPSAVQVANGQLVLSNLSDNWSKETVSSVASWARSDVSGNVLRMTWTEGQMTTATMDYILAGAHDGATGFVSTGSWPDYCYNLYGMRLAPTNAGTLLAWQVAKPPAGGSDLNNTAPALVTHSVRLTFDPVQGALYEYNIGNGWVILTDTRGQSGDTVAQTLRLRFDGCSYPYVAGNGIIFENVLVEYVSWVSSARHGFDFE